jgi:hypothetical protein
MLSTCPPTVRQNHRNALRWHNLFLRRRAVNGLKSEFVIFFTIFIVCYATPMAKMACDLDGRVDEELGAAAEIA